MRYSSVTLATSLIIVQCFFVHISGASRSPGEISPQSIEIKIGGSANITCIMNLQMFSGKDSSSLYFVEQESMEEVPKQDVVSVNKTSIVYMMRNARSQIKEYMCKSGLDAIGVTKVYVGTEPTDVDDFNCRGYDFTYMVCNFSIPSNMILTQYNLSYTAQSPNYLQMCELEIQDQHGICNLTLERSNYRPNYEFYNFTLIGNNPLGTHRQTFWINHYESVIPPRPEYVFEQLTDNSVVLEWNLVKYSYYNSRGLRYEIRILPDDFEWMDHSNYEIRNNKSEYKLKLLNLPYAFYWYNVSVRMKIKSAREDDTMWSESYLKRFQTKPRLPESPPMLDVGSFYVDSFETHLKLYWQQLPVYHENGPNFKYIITSVKRDGEEIKILPIHIDSISATLVWNKSSHYEITIKSKNDEGESVESSKIFVHPMRRNHEDNEPKWIRNVYHALNHTYTLSWSPPVDSKNIVDYTVFWCQSKQATLNECRSTIQFQHINKNTTKFTTSPQLQEHALNFAVSANYKDYNSGMRWTMCTADVTSDLVKLEPEIMPISPRSIKVQWSPDRVCTSLVEGYNLTYCRVDIDLNVSPDAAKCLEKNNTITIEKTAKKYFLNNLQSFSSYKIEINMFSKLKRGKISDSIVVKTLEEAPSPPRNLKYRNITSNSAWISWNVPSQINGNLRYYAIIQNNEQHIVNCTILNGSICNNDKEELSFKLENLSSYTDYKVYIIAHTVEDSFPSNDIHFKTLIGIPSNPHDIVMSETNHTIMQWSPPSVPSGRVEYYEVAVIVFYKNETKYQRISGVVDATSCAVHIPLCPDTDYKYKLRVRAINVAERSNEVDHHVFASNYTEDDVDDRYHYENDDLKCIGTAFTEAEQTAIVQRYRNKKKFKQYKSVWQDGSHYGCAATTLLSRITTIALLVLITSFSVMAAFYFARNKYNKMANIDCALPPGLDAMPYPTKGGVDNAIIDKEDEELHRSKESLYNNEKHHLLSSICNDSGFICGRNVGSGLNNSGPCSIGKSSGYVGSDRSDDYSQHVRHPTKTVQIDSSYMVMEVLKPKVDSDVASKPKNAIPVEDNGYVKPGVATSFLALKPTTLPIIPSNNGYIKPNKLFHWQPQSGGHRKSIPQESDTIAVSSSGYVQPQTLIKNTLQPTADGYTSLEALGKTTLGVSLQSQSTSPHIFGGHSSSPAPISGYVTQKELSAFGQQGMS